VSRYHSYLNSAKQILKQYQGEEPFSTFLKRFFRAEKKHGSKDRKQIAHLCYCYFRLGKSVPKVSIEERILIGLFLCSTQPGEMLEPLKPEWDKAVTLSIEEKCSMLNGQFSTLHVFPWKEELSEGVDHEKFCESFFVQPDLFLRLRPGNEEKVKSKLSGAGIGFNEINSTCLSLANATKIESIVALDREAVVQDYNSQKVGAFLPVRPGRSDQVWDCCAGSGGKSLMAYDISRNIELTVSDARESILVNLKKRFANAGIRNYKSAVIDLSASHSPFTIQQSLFDLIICDVPCTGSGTWSRTPEQLYFFDEKKIEQYSSRQRKIISNTVIQMQPGGHFLYITCSVFKKENEEIVDFIKEQFHLELIKMEWLNGDDKKADSLFVALFRRSIREIM
jgi:16S rRNA (cytosine967-C5)-methyltransferase